LSADKSTKKVINNLNYGFMKRILLLICSMTSGIGVSLSQVETTSYGVSAGTLGIYSSYYGFEAGFWSAAEDYDNVALGHNAFRQGHGDQNVAVGSGALLFGGDKCTAIGYGALYQNQGDAAADGGIYNTAIGIDALFYNLTGDRNTGTGSCALQFNQGNENTATGAYALRDNSDGSYNVANGAYSLNNNSSGTQNTAVGNVSLFSNTTGNYNTASGGNSLYSNISGQMNTASGYYSLYSNSTGHFNTSAGGYALSDNISASYNTATGYYALKKNNLGAFNTADGYSALTNNTTGSYNAAGGSMALNKVASGSYNTGFGYRAGQSTDVHLDNTTAIGYLATPTASHQVRIGNTSVTSIGGYQNWTNLSDGRFKKDIREDVSGLAFINELRPVSYTVDKIGLNRFLHITDSSASSADAKNIQQRQTGFIAQDVEAIVKKSGYVFSGVDAPDNENDPYGIRYAEFVVPLVKAVQELTGRLEAQQQQITEQQTEIQSLRRELGSKSGTAFSANTTAALLQNNPNPFDAETGIQMTLPEDVGYATIMIYNLEGKQLKTIQVAERGNVRLMVSANELAAGMYLYSLIADGKVVDTKRMVLTK
jgi:trimeric autotransporter adhesin